MRREMAWVRSDRLWAGLAQNAHGLNPSGAPIGKSLEEMKRQFEFQRDKAIAGHVGNELPS